MDETLKAYLAGCLDCDGWLTIKRNTYAMRVRGDASQPVYGERVGLKQITPDVPALLREYFGGYLRTEKPSVKNGRPLHSWSATDKQAIECVSSLLPYMRVKRQQAEILLQLRALKVAPRTRSGTFTMTNRWGDEVVMPRRVVAPDVMAEKERLFNLIKSLNDGRPTKPRLV